MLLVEVGVGVFFYDLCVFVGWCGDVGVMVGV